MNSRFSNHIELQDQGNRLQLRRSLFWDMPEGGLDLRRNRQLIIERVFSRGNIEEFKQIINYYPENEIRKAVVNIGTLDKKTLNFISGIYHIKPEEFKCYTGKQSVKKY